LKLWDVESGKSIRTLGNTDTLSWTGHFSQDGKYLVTQRANQIESLVRLAIWEVATGKEIVVLNGHEAHIVGALFTPDGKNLYSGSGDKDVKFWDLATGKELWSVKYPVQVVALSPDGKVALAATPKLNFPARHLHYGTRLDLFDTATGKLLKTLKHPPPPEEEEP
jgi:hypothetical protein